MASLGSPDEEIRAAAGLAVTRLVQSRGTNVLPWAEIDKGFVFHAQTIRIANRAVGIFKPKELQDGAALSIKQVRPSRTGRAAPYDDRDLADGLVAYRLERSDAASHYNKYLVEAHKKGLPLIFLRGVADSIYEVIYPVFVQAIDFGKSEALVAISDEPLSVGLSAGFVEEPIEREYSLSIRKSRLHQKAFRRRVLLAYGLRCALTGLPLPELLQAAHIIADSDGGEPSVRNGIAMSYLHHAAYEENLLGIDPDGIIHLSDTIRSSRDGPLLDHGLQQLEGQNLRMPLFDAHRPDRDFLGVRFEEFQKRGL